VGHILNSKGGDAVKRSLYEQRMYGTEVKTVPSGSLQAKNDATETGVKVPVSSF
jgi:hypothetical protein